MPCACCSPTCVHALPPAPNALPPHCVLALPAPQAALLAMASGKEFTIRVQALESQYRAAVAGYGPHCADADAGEESGPPCPMVLTILFRPAGPEPLRAGQPQIGARRAAQRRGFRLRLLALGHAHAAAYVWQQQVPPGLLPNCQAVSLTACAQAFHPG